MNYYFLFIVYVFYTMKKMLEKKQIRVIFLLEFKMGHKVAVNLQYQQHIWPRNC